MRNGIFVDTLETDLIFFPSITDTKKHFFCLKACLAIHKCIQFDQGHPNWSIACSCFPFVLGKIWKSYSKLFLFCVLKNAINFFLRNQISKWWSFEKSAYFDLLSTFLVTREKTQKFLQYISHLHTYTYFAHPIDFFLPSQFFKKCEFIMYIYSFFFWCDSWCWLFFAPFWSNRLITKWSAKFRLECLLLIFIYTNAKFIVICKLRTLNDGRWRLRSIQKTKNVLLLSSSHFVFYR